METQITRCGPQLRYGDHTLNVDGWELVKYSPCYSNLGFVNWKSPHLPRSRLEECGLLGSNVQSYERRCGLGGYNERARHMGRS